MKRLLLISLLVVSCGDPTSFDSLAGTYTLESAVVEFGGGITVPMTPPDITGTLTLTENQYTASVALASEDLTNVETETGSYTTSGSSVTFRPDGGGSTQVSQVLSDGRKITFLQTITDEDATVTATIIFVR